MTDVVAPTDRCPGSRLNDNNRRSRRRSQRRKAASLPRLFKRPWSHTLGSEKPDLQHCVELVATQLVSAREFAMEMLRAVILNEDVFRFVNVLISLVGLLAVMWVVARMKPIPRKD